MISFVILAFTTSALAASLLYIYRVGARERQRLYAVTLANSAIEEVKGMLFTGVGNSTTDPNDPVSRPSFIIDAATGTTVFGDISGSDTDYSFVSTGGATLFDSTPPHFLGQFEDGGTGNTFLVTRSFRGFGRVASATSTSVTGNFNQGQDPMINDEFVGQPIMITSGNGIGQIRTVTGNNATQLTVTPAWAVQPNTSSVFQIGGGKTMEVIVRWIDRKTDATGSLPREYRMTSLIIPRS